MYRSPYTQYQGNVLAAKGPGPGLILVNPVGVNVDLSMFTTPAYCEITNLDATNFMEVGIWDPMTLRFYPMDEILPKETYVKRLSRFLGKEFGTGPGTGTTGSGTRLRLRSDTASLYATVNAFEA